MDEPLRLLIADDHTFFRRGLRAMLEEEPDLRVMAEAADGEEAVRQARVLGPGGLDLVLMDVEMPRLDGISATRRIRAEVAGLPVVMLTANADDETLFAAIAAGAARFLNKGLSADAMVRTLRDYHREGALPMTRTMAAKAIAYLQAGGAATGTPAGRTLSPAMATLTPREREILALLGTGARDREIAVRLSLAEQTVKGHIKRLLRKLGVRNRTEAAARVHQDR